MTLALPFQRLRLWYSNFSNLGRDFGLEHDLGQDYNVADEDYLPTIEELLRLTSRKENSAREPPNAEHAVQKADQQSLDSSSISVSTEQSRLAYSLGSQGTDATPLFYKQAA